MPVVVTYYPATEASLAEAVGSVLSKLEQVLSGCGLLGFRAQSD